MPAGTWNLGRLRKRVDYVGLRDLSSVVIRDNSVNSDQFFNITDFPTTLTGGKNLYTDKSSSEEVEKDRLENNNQFEKTIYFSNIYNRCISFDSSTWHCADEFSGEDERLTLIIFWEKINGPMTNLQNSKSFPAGSS